MEQQARGRLMIIGGAEDKEGDKLILKHFVQAAGAKEARIVVFTTATTEPKTLGNNYFSVFKQLGAGEVQILDVKHRAQAQETDLHEKLKDVTGVFFTGGDQLRITSIIGGTLLDNLIHNLYLQGVIIGGTSAGASMMSDTMIVEGAGDDAPRKNIVNLAPGLGLLEKAVIDQHFAQRGRIGRLLTAIAQNPAIIGIGIDEDTAICVYPQGIFRVIGSQTVTVLDGRSITNSNASQATPNQPLAITHVGLHVLPDGYGFDLKSREPLSYEVDKENRKETL